MDLKTFIEQTEPEVLQKLAADAQDELVGKVVEAMLPMFEKTANYTAYLILQKLAEESSEKEQEIDPNAEAAQIDQHATLDSAIKDAVNSDPVTAGKSNESVDPSVTPGGLKAQDIKDAISEAIQVGQSEKILPFIKAVAGQYPDTVNEIIKMVKIELHDGIMKKLVDEETAISITDQLNSMVGA